MARSRGDPRGLTTVAENIKGAVVLSYLEIVEKQLGKDGSQVILAKLSTHMQGVLAGLHAAAWVPEDLLADVIGAIAEKYGAERVRAIGHDQQVAMTKRTHAFFGRLAGPQNLVRIAARVWSQFRDAGDATAEMMGDKGARLLVRHHRTLRRPGCAESFLGSCTAALEVTKAKNVRGTHRMTDEAVIFEFSWD
ncbi:MAG: hypothetical protein IT381_11720 [Deltaproteobacteria bacterium]|nr:hypothetical protein [Deltaproteobacteria bacterium]